MQNPQDNEILATVMPSPARRVVGVAMLVLLGGLLIYLAFITPSESILWRLVFLIFGGLALWVAGKMRKATANGVVLTRDGLFSTDGKMLLAIGDMHAVVRGTFALKPSNGFSVIANTRLTRGWAPGVWWRYGKRMGVGGVTAASQAKFMAEILAAKLAEDNKYST